MKYIHTIINNAVTNPFIDIVNQNFNPNDHRFYVIRGMSQDLCRIRRSENVFIISNISNILNGFRLMFDILISKKVFIHGLFTPYLVAILFFQPWVLKKCNWLIWGGDLYSFNKERLSFRSKLVEYMRARVIREMGRIITSIKGDYDLAKTWYNVKGTRENAYYPFELGTEQIDKILSKIEKDDNIRHLPTKIMIGNSAYDTNNHFEIIDLLQQYHNQNVKIYALLAYGDIKYAKKVCEKGKQIFGEKFIGITDYVPFEEFVLFYNKIDILIFNHERQQGLGNLFLALYLGKKIYINNKSPLWQFFKDDLGLIVNRTGDIGKKSFFEFSNADNLIVEKNRQIINTILQEDHLIKQWKELFS